MPVIKKHILIIYEACKQRFKAASGRAVNENRSHQNYTKKQVTHATILQYAHSKILCSYISLIMLQSIRKSLYQNKES